MMAPTLVPDPVPEGSWSKLKVLVVPALLVVALVASLAFIFGGEKKKVTKRPNGAKPTTRRKPRAFISFAVEDESARNLLVGQSKHEDTPFDLADFSLHEPFDNAWKTQTRPRTKGCDVVIVLIGKGTHAAEGVLWEIKAAKEESVPVFVALRTTQQATRRHVLNSMPSICPTTRPSVETTRRRRDGKASHCAFTRAFNRGDETPSASTGPTDTDPAATLPPRRTGASCPSEVQGTQ